MGSKQEYQKRYYAERRAKRRAEGLCILCGAGLPDAETHTTCERCRAKQRLYYLTHEAHEPQVEYDSDEANICLSCTKKACVGTCENYTKQKRNYWRKEKMQNLNETVEKMLSAVQGPLSSGVSSNEDTL